MEVIHKAMSICQTRLDGTINIVELRELLVWWHYVGGIIYIVFVCVLLWWY